MKTYTPEDDREYYSLLHRMEALPQMNPLRETPQHGGNTTFSHCHNVAVISYQIARAFHIRINMQQLVRGAMLHDYYLYDTETMTISDYKHALQHPILAAENASRLFSLSEKEDNIIRSHMWPIPGSPLPKNREAWLVCLADKISAVREMYFGLRELPSADLAAPVPTA